MLLGYVIYLIKQAAVTGLFYNIKKQVNINKICRSSCDNSSEKLKSIKLYWISEGEIYHAIIKFK